MTIFVGEKLFIQHQAVENNQTYLEALLKSFTLFQQNVKVSLTRNPTASSTVASPSRLTLTGTKLMMPARPGVADCLKSITSTTTWISCNRE